MNAPLLEIKKFSHAYQKEKILKEVSLTVQRGEIACILGPSGCGKTTLLRCVGGFERPLTGEIFLDGICVSRSGYLLPPEKRSMGMVFQDYALFGHLTVEQNIAFGLIQYSRKDKGERVGELLELTRLVHVRQLYPHTLSGGQKQRVALARALAPKPELLLLDEPFANLDPSLREEMKQEVRRILKHQGATALMVTHDQHEAFDIGDRVGVLLDGELVQWDTAYDLYHHPKNRFVSSFVGHASFIPGRIVENGVETELGVLSGKAPQACGLGSDVEVLIRPDDIIYDDRQGQAQARVMARIFRGMYSLFRLRLESGREIYCFAPSHHHHSAGSRIRIRHEIQHLVVFPKI